MTQSPYVKSNFERIARDDYKTIDHRCVDALIKSWPISGNIVDCCSPNGSGIVSRFNERGRKASGVADAFSDFEADWIVTNPPYDRNIVDLIANSCVDKLKRGKVSGVAFLMRANWDLSQIRENLFLPPWYSCQIRMRFRPWWSEERTAQPIHNFVWHVWQKSEYEPIIRYYP